MNFTFSTQLHYLVHMVDGEYVAHCLDLDQVGTGDSVDDAVSQLNEAVRAVVYISMKSGAPDTSALCHVAPNEYWSLFDEAKKSGSWSVKTLHVTPEIAPVSVMECHFTYCLAIAA